MPLQDRTNLHIDAVLSNIMVGRRSAGLIVDDLVPVINVSKQSNVYYKSNYKEALLYQAGLSDRAKNGLSREVYWSVSSDTYYARNYALATRWSSEDAANADDPIKLRQKSARLVTDRLKLDYEVRINSIANVSTNVSTTYSVATPWSNVTGSRPFSDLSDRVEDFRALTTKRPNVLILPEQVARVVRKSDEVRDILFGDKGGVATDQQIAALLKVDRILVPEAFVNSAGVGETLIGSGETHPVWGNKAFLAYVANLENAEEEDTWISAFRWTSPEFATPWAIQAFPYDAERRSQKVEASYYQGEKIISSDLGLAINSII